MEKSRAYDLAEKYVVRSTEAVYLAQEIITLVEDAERLVVAGIMNEMETRQHICSECLEAKSNTVVVVIAYTDSEPKRRRYCGACAVAKAFEHGRTNPFVKSITVIEQ